jgi:hypothetical protein
MEQLGQEHPAGPGPTEQGKQLIKLDLSAAHIVQDMSREGLKLLCRFDQPLQDRIRVHLAHPRCAPDAQPLGQAREDAHDELDGGVLTS